ncbi:MAG: aminodeoxychorismate synthase component I [Porticoccus sp.]|nr:aminodeoxychorismate synthase component I [Porticoccus sp.]MBQ0807065.1 aminodeoxychorismate synthase component I [Porticoccus sp.]
MKQVDIVDFPYRPDAEQLFGAVRDLPDAIWLDSGKPRSLYGRFDIISAQPDTVLETVGKTTRIITSNTTISSEEDPFLLAEDLLSSTGSVDSSYNSHPFIGGLAGYFGYDLARSIEVLPDTLRKVDNLPDMRIGNYSWALVLNHSEQKAWLFFRHSCPANLRQEITQRLQQASHVIDDGVVEETLASRHFSSSISKNDYLQTIAKVKQYISEGDCYQANIAQHFSAPFNGDNWALYRFLRRVLPAAHSCFYQWGEHNQAVLSFSPERFLKLSMGHVETKPIKGTARRGNTVDEDQLNAIALMNSSKNRAENLMIVDLLRNDLGKTCEPGSIRVPKLFALESFPNVHHLVSTVTGKLRSNESALSLLRGCFPGGSITGAPKKRAMEIIEELEVCRRSVYCGSIGYISATGRMDSNIAIRTLIADGEKLHCWGGGGIVADSIAESEFEETLDKIRVLIQP